MIDVTRSSPVVVMASAAIRRAWLLIHSSTGKGLYIPALIGVLEVFFSPKNGGGKINRYDTLHALEKGTGSSLHLSKVFESHALDVRVTES